MPDARERVEALEKVLKRAGAADDVLDAMAAFYRNRDWLLRVAKAAVAWRGDVDGMSHESDPCDDCRGCQLIAAVDDAEVRET